MKFPEISIALTTYNGVRYLRQQIESLMTQTMPFDELIICDDTSTDETQKILKEYTDKDSRVKVHYNTDNLGFKTNFEKSLNLCTGNFIALCDQDDVWLPNHIETLYNNIGDRLLACGDAELIDRQGNRINQRLSKIKNFNKKGDDCKSIFRFIAYYQNPFQGASMMMRREFLNIALPIPTSVKYHDVWFAHLACAMNEFIYIDKPITMYRMHGDNASGNHVHKNHWRSILGHIVKKNLGNNRKEVIDAIENKIGRIDASFRPLIKEATTYYNNNRGYHDRLRNMIFELKNHKSIYG